ncbi:hypothetical protein AVEN_64886-1 [Araneus ventricosus]|uniref:Transposase Tc1-like domain-containing protein n=1 Tax=Araneus ventricosus TaxID=182803 RepID=A0A4Y2J4B6_ARAVE|nr:hypothetical protein AVEN_64886-1 [Araneus ventricosus]
MADLIFYHHKIKPVHLLQDRDSEVRTTFELKSLARMVVDVTWPWNILWSDGAHFCLNGHFNTHKCQIVSAENPHTIHEKPLHSDKVIVWCGFKAAFIIGPYFFKEITANGIQTCSVTGKRYRDMLRDFEIPQIQQRRCLQDIIFMQYGAPRHIDRRVTQLLRQHFTDARVINHHFRTAWPRR